MSQQSVVSISDASHILGVSEAALRQWTDEGKIKAFITPGGHRRFSIAELKKFMSSHQKVLGIKELAAELEDTIQQHREIARTHLSTTLWYHRLSQESQEWLASIGRRLLDLIIVYITEPAKREETVRLARDAGYSFGATLARLGLPLTDSVEAFILHRDPMMKVATQLMKKGEALNRRVVEAVPMVTHIMDEALVSLIAGHQQHQNTAQNESKGGTFN